MSSSPAFGPFAGSLEIKEDFGGLFLSRQGTREIVQVVVYILQSAGDALEDVVDTFVHAAGFSGFVTSFFVSTSCVGKSCKSLCSLYFICST